MPNQIHERINLFKADLQLLLPIEVIRKHIIYGDCYALSQDQYFDLRSEVAEHFEIHPNEVLVIGSAKLGFSIAPHKRYRPFSDQSDIDVVIVSRLLFDKIWHSVFIYWNRGGRWGREQDFKNYLFRGWIRPDKFPPSRTFPIGQEWWEFFNGMELSAKYGFYHIRAALYKSWYHIESYQEAGVQDCMRELRGDS